MVISQHADSPREPIEPAVDHFALEDLRQPAPQSIAAGGADPVDRGLAFPAGKRLDVDIGRPGRTGHAAVDARLLFIAQ